MPVQTGQRTTANSKATSTPAAAPKKATASKATPAKKKAASRSKQIEVEIASNPFTPGEKVQIHNELEVDVQRREGREPQATPVTTTTADKDGTFSVSGLKAGTYVAYGEDSENWLTFPARKK